jgi:hydroxypyruvate isomerase
MPRFAANLGFLFPEHDFLDRFGAARACGFRAVEFALPYLYPHDLLARKLRENALECILLNLPMGDRAKGDYGIACRPERVDEFREGVAAGIGYAQALGCRRMNCISGVVRPGEEREVLLETLISNLRMAAREFKRCGLELVVEPLNTRDAPGFIVPRAAEMVDVIARVGEPNVGLQLDLYHTVMMGDDPFATLRALRPHVRHIQFADVPGRGEPGSGSVDLPALFAEIDALGYEGWVSAEYKPTRPTAQTVPTFLG